MADRFFTDLYNAETYTQAGLDYIKNQGSIKDLLVRNCPELGPELKFVANAFIPWKNSNAQVSWVKEMVKVKFDYLSLGWQALMAALNGKKLVEDNAKAQ
jgi:hypothetical protein